MFNELEDCYPSDSDPEDDEVSIMSVLSTPRPTLRPFFSEGNSMPTILLVRCQPTLLIATSQFLSFLVVSNKMIIK